LTTVHVGEGAYALGIGALGPPVAAVPSAECPVPGGTGSEPGTARGAPGAAPECRLLDRLGELLTVPGAVYWLPGGGRQGPDFLLTTDGLRHAGGGEVATRAQLPIHLLCGMILEGSPRVYGRFTAADLDGGAELGDLTRAVLDWSSRQKRFAGLVGLALRAE